MKDSTLARIRKLGLNVEDFETNSEKDTTNYVYDEQGNKYIQKIEDGQIALKLVEDYQGLLYE